MTVIRKTNSSSKRPSSFSNRRALFVSCPCHILSATWPRRPLWYGSLLRGTRDPAESQKDGGSLFDQPSEVAHTRFVGEDVSLKYNYILGKYQWSGQRSLGHATALGPPPVGCLW